MSGQITALYHNLYDAGRAIEDLVASGVAPDEISVVTSEARAALFEVEYEEAARGPATASGAIGGALRAIGANLITSPGDSGIIATGPLRSTLSGEGGMRTLADTLQAVGFSKRGARFYSHEIRKHDALMVGVEGAGYESEEVRSILGRHHATAISDPA